VTATEWCISGALSCSYIPSFGFINLTDEIPLMIAVLFATYVSFYLNTCLQFIAARSAHWYLNNISSHHHHHHHHHHL
jgi:hypothetical protein